MDRLRQSGIVLALCMAMFTSMMLLGGTSAIAAGPSWYVTKKSDMAQSSYQVAGYQQSEVTADRKIYLFGGGDTSNNWSNAISSYDITSNSWQTLSNTLPYTHISNSRHNSALASNGKYYLSPGNGSGGWGTHNRIIEVDITGGTAIERAAITGGNIWEIAMAPAPAAKGGVYLFGGWNGGGDAAIRHYNPTTDTITTVASLSAGRTIGARVVHPNGKIYLFGGNDNSTSTIEKFDTANESLTTIPNPGGLLFNHQAIAWVGSDNMIYLWNGTSTNLGTSSDKLFKFDPATETFADLGIPSINGNITVKFGSYAVRDAATDSLYLLSHYDGTSWIGDISVLNTSISSVPVDTTNWQKLDCGNWENTAEGLKVFGTHYRGGTPIHSKQSYDFTGKTVYMKWKANGGGTFCDIVPKIDRAFEISPNLSTGNSWLGSSVVTEDAWYFTRIKVNADKTWSSVTSTGNYDDAGGTLFRSGSGTMTDAQWAYIKRTNIGFREGDCSAGVNAYYVMAEVKTDATPVTVVGTPTTYNFEDVLIPAEFTAPGWTATNTGVNGSIGSITETNQATTLTINASGLASVSFKEKYTSSSIYNGSISFSIIDNATGAEEYRWGWAADSTTPICWNDMTFQVPDMGLKTLKWTTTGGAHQAWLDDIVLNKVTADATCGTAIATPSVTKPTANLCGDGSLPTVSCSGSWAWICAGINGGVSTNCTAPKTITPPSNIEIQAPTIAGQLVSTWTKPTDSDFSHIHIYRSTVAGQPGSLIIPTDEITGIKYTDTGLASQTKYYYTVRSVDTAGNESTNTTQVSGTTLDSTPPDAATSITITDPATGGKLNITWTKPTATDFASVTIYRSTANGTLGSAIAAAQTGSSYPDSGLTNGTSYYYTLRAYDTSGNYSDSTQLSGTPSAPVTPLPPVIPCAGAITQPNPKTGTLLIHNWTNPADPNFAKLRIYASTASGTLGSVVYEGNNIETTFNHTDLTRNSSYYYTYRSVNPLGTETTNTTQCEAIPLDQAAPACPTGMTGTINGDKTVTLTWNRSASSDIGSYQIFASSADADVTYTTPTATVDSPAVTWTTPAALTQGKTYKFGIRTVDNLISSPNISGNCGEIALPIPNLAPACSVSTSIKVPHTGKKLGGSRATVKAEVTSGSESNLASVTFQYRPSGVANSWLNMPTDIAKYPNPDLDKQWFVKWNISAITLKTDYDIRAVATCTNSQQDPLPGYITVTIDKTDFDSEEDDNGDGEDKRSEKVGGDADCHIEKGDDGNHQTTSLTLPAGSTPEGTHVTVTESNPATKAALVPADHESGNCFREITFSDGRHYLDNNKKAELAIPYKDDSPEDGIVDGTTINVHDLQICDYDGINKIWNCLDSIVDKTTKTVKANSNSFSLFGLLAPPKPLETGWNLVSVPLTPIPAIASNIFGAIAYSYNTNTGLYPIAPTVEPGKAYWVRNGFTSIKATGTETPETNFSIPIIKGWNLIGNPFRYKINVSDLKITNGTTETISTAETNGWVIGTLFNYQNGSYLMSTWQDNGTFDPWKGYWILSDINGTLTVPNKPIQ